MTIPVAQAAVILSYNGTQVTATVNQPIVFTTVLASDLTTDNVQVVFKDVYNSSKSQDGIDISSTSPTLTTPSGSADGGIVFRSYTGADVNGTDLVLNFNFTSPITLQNNQTVTLSTGFSTSFIFSIAAPDNTAPTIYYLANGGDTLDDGTYISAAVPESSSYVLALSGLIGILVLLRRRRLSN